MSDIAIHIQVNDAEQKKVIAPSDMKASEFLKELRVLFRLPAANGNGNRLDWKLCDKITGRMLEPDRTLHENGVHAGQELILRANEAKPDPPRAVCQHCGLENDLGNKFCLECGKPMGRPKASTDLRFRVHAQDGKSQEVEVPGDFTTKDLIGELLGSAAKESEWTLYDKDTGENLDPAKSLAENGVRSGHEVYLTKLPPDILPITKEDKPKPLSPPVPIWKIVAVVVVLAAGGFLLYSLFSGGVAIRPATANLKISEHQQFTAKVGGAPGAVSWSINPPMGTIDSQGLYTAPRSVSTQTAVTVTATSVANPKKSATGKVTLEPGREVVEVNPGNATLMGGESQKFTANVSGTGNTEVRWSINPEVGSISPDGRYTAPAPVPEEKTINVTATSVADADRSASASVALKPVTVAVSPNVATVLASAHVRFEATLGGTSNQGIRWSVSGPGYVSKNGVYFAPPVVSGPETARVTATSSADPAKSATTVVRLQPVVAVGVSPASSNLGAGQRERFSVTITGTSNTAVRWTLSGPGSVSPDGEYQAPASIGTEKTARITVTSQADTSKSASASVTLRPVAVTIAPASAELWVSQTRRFSALVTNSNTTGVRWTLSGPGSVSSEGVYQAPASIGSEQTARITVTSEADTSKNASASITLRPVAVTITPASAELWASQTRRFSAVVTNSNTTGVRWTLAGRGRLTQEGVYTAPTPIPADQNAKVTATSIADPARSATVNVTLKRYNGPMTGTLVWSGTLPKNGTVTIDEAGASQGKFQGDVLPGLPVQIKLDNNKEYGIAQPPAPSNGWKRVTLSSKRGKGTGVRITWSVVF